MSLFIILQACGQNYNAQQELVNDSIANDDKVQKGKVAKLINKNGSTLQTRIIHPKGFQRLDVAPNSFAEYLRNLPLKLDGSKVKYFDGTSKPNSGVYVAVVDIGIGNKDLHQCADAVMRLWAEYLWKQKKYEQIHFNLTNGFRVDYSEWMKGKRIIVKGNKTTWSQKGIASNTYRDFWNYMELVFSYAGTLSLSKELKSVDIVDIKIGDVFIKGGTPGHAVIVVDMATDIKSNKKVLLLAQSYMPAQELQILCNPIEKSISPWYSSDIKEKLVTPEWVFKLSELKRFVN